MSLDAEWRYIYDLTESIEIPEDCMITKIKGSKNICSLRTSYNTGLGFTPTTYHFEALQAFNKLVLGNKKNILDTRCLVFFNGVIKDINVCALVDSTKGFHLGVRIEKRITHVYKNNFSIRRRTFGTFKRDSEQCIHPNIGVLYMSKSGNDNNHSYSYSDSYFHPNDNFKEEMKQTGMKFNTKICSEKKISKEEIVNKAKTIIYYIRYSK